MRSQAASWGWLQRHAGRGRLGGLVDTSFEAVLPCSALWIHHRQRSLRAVFIPEVGHKIRLGIFHLADLRVSMEPAVSFIALIMSS